MSTPIRPLRVAKLSSYLGDLIADVAAEGKIAKIDGNPVQVAAVALLSGSIAVINAMWSDITILAGNAKTVARVAAPSIAARLAGDVVAHGLNKLFGGKQGR